MMILADGHYDALPPLHRGSAGGDRAALIQLLDAGTAVDSCGDLVPPTYLQCPPEAAESFVASVRARYAVLQGLTPLLEESEDMFRRWGYELGVAYAEYSLGYVAQHAGDHKRMAAYFSASLRRFRQM